MLTIRYYNRAKHRSIEIEIPADVVAVKIPPQESQPALEVNINTDAVLVDRAGPCRLGMLTYSDLLAEAEADGIRE
jgi:hypothetical protein